MGIFDFLKKGQGKKSQPPPDAEPLDKKVAGPAKTANDKRAQAYDRMEAIQQLVEMKSVPAATALLKRFTFTIDPSITDHEEKEYVFHGIVAVGPEMVGPIAKFCRKAELLSWPLKCLRELLDDDHYREELIAMLEKHDTEYSRNVEPKIALITALGDLKADEVREAVEPYLDDVNETVRFHAVDTTFAQEDEASLEALVELLEREESVRIKNKVAEGIRAREWKIPEDLRERATSGLKDAHEYSIKGDGSIAKR